MGLSDIAAIFAERLGRRGRVAIASCASAFVMTMLCETKLGAAATSAVVAVAVALFADDDARHCEQEAPACK